MLTISLDLLTQVFYPGEWCFQKYDVYLVDKTHNSVYRSVEQLSSPIEPEPINISRRPKQPQTRTSSGRGGTWGSISRVFARSRHRNKASSLQETSEFIKIGYSQSFDIKNRIQT